MSTETISTTNNVINNNEVKSKGHSNVKELKRLFESKKTVVLDKLSSLKSNRFKNKDKEKEKEKDKVEKDKEKEKEKEKLKEQKSKKVIEEDKNEYEDIEISSSERKYFYYINEAIRKNIPIVPSLAIRRKSLDLTHSPIKGSLYASKYQHNYSPSTRTIQLAKNKKSVTVPPPQFNPDTSWIKKGNDESILDSKNNNITTNKTTLSSNNESRPTLQQSKSTFELKQTPIYQSKSKEEPTPKKSTTLSISSSGVKNNNNNNNDISNNNDNNNNKDNEDKKSIFSWATLRRMKRSQSTVDDSPLFIISPPLNSTINNNNKQTTTTTSTSITTGTANNELKDQQEVIGISNQSSSTSPKQLLINQPIQQQRKHGSSLELSTSSKTMVVTNTAASPPEVKRYVSQSVTILRKDIAAGSSHSSPSSPGDHTPPKNKFISIAKSINRIQSTDELKFTPAKLEPTVAHISESEPSSPVLSPSKAQILQVTNPRLEVLIQSTRTRSSSVGSLIESTKYELVDIPPLKVHVSTLEECLDTFTKPYESSGGGRCFVLDLANCSLGNEGLIQIAENCPGNIEIADLSWNDISGEGLEVFTNMLVKTQSLFTSLSLQGNSISPNNLQSFLESISNIKEIKKSKFKGFGLNLRETGIENEGAELLANYIGSNQFPYLIGLNLTYASVTDIGMSYFSSALVRNTYLTTLILDENYLGDDGACLLAEGLKFNKSLTHLQMRNADVGERGTVELCNACKFNTTIALLDLSLNPWELNGEMALQSLLNSKQMMSKKQKIVVTKVMWKDEGLGQWEEEEIHLIIQHFGKEKMIDLLINGFSLSPLIEQEQLFEYFKLDTNHLSKIFKQIVGDNQTDNSSHALKLLVDILPSHLNNYDFLTSFLNNMSSLVSILDRSFKRIDLFFLKLLEFFDLLIQSDNVQCFDKLNECCIFDKCLDLIYEFSTNNILHQKVLNLFISTIKNSNFEQNVFNNEYIGKLITYLTMESDNIPGNRSPNFGHLLEISKLISKSSHPFLQTKEWKQYQMNILDRETKLQESYLCGFIPDRNMKLDSTLLDKFEKEFKK